MEEKITHNSLNSFQLLMVLIIPFIIVFSVSSSVLTNHFEYAILGFVIAMLISVVSKRIQKM